MGNGITRAGVASATTAGALEPADLRAAIAACDPDRAAELALARLQRGDALDLGLVGELVPLLLDVPVGCALIALAEGDAAARAATCLAMLDRFPVFADGYPLQVMVLWAAWRSGAERVPLVAHARRLARRKLDKVERALVYYLAGELADPQLTRLVEALPKPKVHELKPLAAESDRLLAPAIARVIAELPAQGETSKSVGFTVRTTARVGRNEPCPCGSGQKYKKCCADKDASAEGSPIAGMSWDAFLTEGVAQMTPEQVEALSMFDLARIDRSKLQAGPAVVAIRRFLRERYWDLAIATADTACANLADPVARDDVRDEVVASLIDAGEHARVRTELAKYATPDPLRTFELAMHDDAVTLAQLDRELTPLVDRAQGLVDVAHVVLRVRPALGIALARAAFDPRGELDNTYLVEAIEDARDAAGLAPIEPASTWMLGAAEGGDAKHARARQAPSAEDVELHGQLRELRAKVARLEHEVRTAREAAQEHERAAAAERAAGGDVEQLKRLRRKVEELEGVVREGQAERAELRAKLGELADAAATAPAPTVTATVATDEDEGDAIDDALPELLRDVSVPVFSRRTQDALESVPRAVASEALRTIGTLAAGDLPAWRRAKLARDMVKPVAMARIGIHHRLLFRREGGTLEILDLITREELLATLKRIRNART